MRDKILYVLKVLLLALVYFAVGKLSLLLAIPPGFATPVWPSAGIALAAILLGGYKYLPGVFIGSLATNLLISYNAGADIVAMKPVMVAMGIAVGAFLQAAISAFFVNRCVTGATILDKHKGILALVLFGGVVGCLVNSLLGPLVLLSAGFITSGIYFASAFTWWVGDTIGVVLFTPALVLLSNKSVSYYRKAIVTIPILLFSIITIFIFVNVKEGQSKKNQIEFDYKVKNIVSQFKKDLGAYSTVLAAVERFIRSSKYVSYKQFEDFTTELLRLHPAMRSLSWNQVVTDRMRESYERNIREQGYANFFIKDRLGRGVLEITEGRKVYCPVTYIVPYLQNELAHGFDACGLDGALGNVRKRALDKARDTGEFVATGRITLVQVEGQYGLLIYDPVYKNDFDEKGGVELRRENLRGYVAGVFVLKDMFSTIARVAEKENFHFVVSDLTADQERQFLYDSRAIKEVKDDVGVDGEGLQSLVNIDVGGRKWQFRFIHKYEVANESQGWKLWYLLIGGLLFTAILGILLFFFSVKAEKFDREIQSSIKNREELFIDSFISVTVSGLFATLLGIIVIVGWYTHNVSLIQVLPQFVPMQYNTALGFLLSGLALLSLKWGNPYVTFGLSFWVALLGILTLVEYIFAVDFGIDQLFMEHYVTTKTSHPGRMAPNTAMCFVLTSFALMTYKRKSLLMGFSVSMLFLSLLALLGYMTGMESVYGWGALTKMAVHTAVGFVIISVGLFVLSIRTLRNKIDLWSSLPTIALIIFISMTIMSVYFTQGVVKRQNQRHFQTLIDESTFYIEKRFLLYKQSLLGAAGLVNSTSDLTSEVWRVFVDSLDMEHTLPGINGIGFIDNVAVDELRSYLRKVRGDLGEMSGFVSHSETGFDDKFIVRYIEPFSKNKETLGFDIGFEKNRRDAAEYARDYGIPTLTKMITLVQDSDRFAGFLYLIPTYKTVVVPATIEERRKQFRGWVYAPFIGDSFLSELNEFNDGQISFEVYDGGNEINEEFLIYRSHLEQDVDSSYDGLYKTTLLPIAGNEWTIIWKITDKFKPQIIGNIPVIVGVLGVIFSIIVSGVLYLLSQIYGSTAKKLEAKESHLKAVFETVPDGILSVDHNGLIVTVNKDITRIFGYSEEELIGEKIELLVPSDQHKQHRKNVDGYVKGSIDVKVMGEGREVFGIHKDGNIIPLDVRLSRARLPDGKLQVVATVRDITDIKRAQDEVMKMVGKLEESNTDLERFAYIASHDLQEPLRMVVNFNGLLSHEYGDKLDEQAVEYIKFSKDAASRMQDLVNDLLEYSRVGIEAEKFVDVDSLKVVENAKVNLMESIKQLDVVITNDDLPVVKGNPIRMTRLFQNLVGNAIKYTKEGVKPEIHIGVEEKGSEWVFSIKDNGIGMRKEYLEQIFVPFKRLHSYGEYVGTGIGLSVCKKIVENMGGRIWVESELGKGSVFYFTVPKKLN